MKQEQNKNSFDKSALCVSPLFKHLNASEVEYISTEKKLVSAKKGTFLYHERNRITGCYIILTGILKIFKTGIDGKEQIIRFARPYDLIGFRSVLNGELACTTAKTLEDATLCYIPQETLFNLIKQNGNFSLALLQLACRELGEANEYITDIAQKTVRERLAEILIHLYNDFGIDNEHFLNISLTREELSNIVGTATESVIRLLSEFKTDKIIDIEGRKIKIQNFSALNKLAGI